MVMLCGLIGALGMLPVQQTYFAQQTLAQGTRADYERSASYARRTADRVFRDTVRPHWFGETQDHFWYQRRTGSETHDYVLVDAKRGHRQAAFDHRALAEQLAQQVQSPVVADRLALSSLRFDEDVRYCEFRVFDRRWRFTLPAGPLSVVLAGTRDDVAPAEGLAAMTQVHPSRAADQPCEIRFENRLDQPLEIFWYENAGMQKSYGRVAPGASYEQSTYVGHVWLLRTQDGTPVAAFSADAAARYAVIDKSTPQPRLSPRRRQNTSRQRSPDGRWEVQAKEFNLVLVDRDHDQRHDVTSDGTAEAPYEARIWWSPDSQHFVAFKTRQGEHREIAMIESAPPDSIHSRVVTTRYDKPGDRLDHPRPVLFHVDDPQPILIDDDDFPNPFAINHMAWHDHSQSFSFVYNQRGHQVLRLISVDIDTAKPRVVVDETSETFVCYSQKFYLHRLDSSHELIWMSERSMWNHLYLIDQQTGEVNSAITSGEYVVREVERIDAEQRRIWLKVSGLDPAEDPYHIHLVRVDFDGGNFTRLTQGDGDHRWQFSPDGRYLIDTYSRVDMPPHHELRDAETGALLCQLEVADIDQLLATPWAPPQRFVATGRDGETDIHGIIVRPTHFDPRQRYPVLEAIYAGPHSAFVPKSFGRHVDLYKMAELGFIVVKIDGMGTNHRSKAFHDVCWQNLGDSGFPDRIAWMRAAAQQHPEMDLSRVGIWGGSAGGQSAMRALIAHGDFYHAAAADCGCHDNRVDKIWWNEQWMGWPIGPHYAAQSNVTQAHRLQGDLLLIWGELDQNVDPASSMQVVDALIKADKDFEQLIVPGAGHGAAGHPYAQRRQADFFVRKLWQREPRSEPSMP